MVTDPSDGDVVPQRPRNGSADRRTVLLGATALAAAGSLTAACGSGAAPTTETTSAAPVQAPPAAPDAATGSDLGAVADIPVGGGVVLADRRMVVVRRSPDDVAAFSAVCTHKGCTVGAVQNGLIVCPCHGSRFGLDGSVAAGPATAPLPPIPVAVSQGRVVQR